MTRDDEILSWDDEILSWDDEILSWDDEILSWDNIGGFVWEVSFTLLGTNISPTVSDLWVDDFLFPRWDVLVFLEGNFSEPCLYCNHFPPQKKQIVNDSKMDKICLRSILKSTSLKNLPPGGCCTLIWFNYTSFRAFWFAVSNQERALFLAKKWYAMLPIGRGTLLK